MLSPSRVSDARLHALGIEPERIGRWDRGVDVDRFSPTLRTRAADGRVRVLYAGRLTKEKGVDLLADAFLAARARDPRLELVLAGGGAEEDALRARLGGAATFLGWLEGDALARAYADADLFLFCSQTDTFGQVVLEAQASGLPVVAVDAGGPSELIASGRSGVLCPPRASALADAVAGLAAHPSSRRRLATGGIAAVRDRTWEASLAALGAGWSARAEPRGRERGGAGGMTGALAVAIHDVEPADLRALRADPRLARRPRRGAGDAAGDPRAAAAPVPRPLPGAGELAAGPRRRGRRRRPARPPAPPHPDAPSAAAACAAEYPGLDAAATIASVETGRNVLTERGPGAARVRRARLRLHGRAARAPRDAASTGGRRC